ncbi:MAG: dihydroneopterin aldolase [Chitinophagia bacterium]|nr:dihydroneopterin aldolase [Chitinophagia bacterium]
MLSVSLHGIRTIGPHGLYPEENILHNHFEADIDVYLPDEQPWPYVDYTIINEKVKEVFSVKGLYLEAFVQQIHTALKAEFPYALRVRVAVRKLHPPMDSQVAYAEVCYDK